jgi:hypothetical protein
MVQPVACRDDLKHDPLVRSEMIQQLADQAKG